MRAAAAVPLQASASFPRVMIFEPLLIGHRSVYVETLLSYLAKLGYRDVVVVLPSDGRATREFATVLKPLSHVAHYQFTIPKIESEGWQQLRHLKALVKAVHRNVPSLVILPTAGYLALWCICLWCVAWSPQFWSTKLHVNMIALPFGYPVTSMRDVVKRLAYGALLALAPIRRTTTIDEINLETSWRFTPRVTRLRYAPEPIPIGATQSKEAERQHLKLPTETLLVGVVGMIDRRKEIELLLAAARHPEWPLRASIVLAGPVDAATHKAILESGLGERLIVHDRFLPEEDIMRYIKALDCLWLVYRGHQGPSATMIKALAIGKKVVAQKDGWIGATAKKAGDCLLVEERSPEAIVRSISALLKSDSVAPHTDLLLKHLPSEFATVVTGLMADAQGGTMTHPTDGSIICT